MCRNPLIINASITHIPFSNNQAYALFIIKLEGDPYLYEEPSHNK